MKEYFTIREYIEEHKLSADPENRGDQMVIGKHLRALGYERTLIREGEIVKRVWAKRRILKVSEQLREELEKICNHVTKL